MLYEVVEKVPSAEDYLALNLAVGWRKIPHLASIEKALRNSVLCLCALQGDRLVGFVRLVGDDSICFYIQDLIVHPDYQRQGVGTALMDHVMGYVREHSAPAAWVGLMAAVDADAFYKRFGFSTRPDQRPGMDLRIWKPADAPSGDGLI